MRQRIAEAFVIGMLVAIIVVPVLWAVAVVQSCGWMGFFVECRITAPR